MYGFVGEFQAVGLAVGLFSWGAELRGLHREQVRAPPLIPCGSELARDDSGTSDINANCSTAIASKLAPTLEGGDL